MGICIHFALAKSVTKEEWESVYRESLKLIEAFPLAELRTVKIGGVEVKCLARTIEHEHVYGWPKKESHIGWKAVGDYTYMCTAEPYYLSKDLVEEESFMNDCEDAMFGVLPAYLAYDWDDKRFDSFYDEWGAKTQGEPYHMYLLAIACLIESRLGTKAFVYGDITRGQCAEAVEMANEILKKPIHIPDRCYPEKLFSRVDTLPVSLLEKLEIFECFYLGNKSAAFGDELRKNFDSKTLNEYWEKRFSRFNAAQIGFNDVFSEYFLWGFDFDEMFSFIKYFDEEGSPQYEELVKRVMDAKMHIKVKDCSDPLKIDQDEAIPYSVYTYFAQFVFAGAENKKVDRYIPIDSIRATLNKYLGDKCDVDNIIDNYLKEEEKQGENDSLADASSEGVDEMRESEPSSLLKMVMEAKKEELEKEQETYDIVEYSDLIFYTKGETISPGIEDNLVKAFDYYCSVREEERYKDLMLRSAKERCTYLSEQNRSLLLRDKDWRKIFKDIKRHKKSFARYYPMVRIKIGNEEIADMIKAIVINDDLYKYLS